MYRTRRGIDTIQDELRVFDRTQVLPQERIGGPDILQHRAVGDYGRNASNWPMVVLVVEIAQFQLGVGQQLSRFAVDSTSGHVDDEAVSL